MYVINPLPSGQANSAFSIRRLSQTSARRSGSPCPPPADIRPAFRERYARHPKRHRP